MNVCVVRNLFSRLIKADRYLPVSFYKHTQGVQRLNEYVQANWRRRKQYSKQKNETLYERFDNNAVMLKR